MTWQFNAQPPNVVARDRKHVLRRYDTGKIRVTTKTEPDPYYIGKHRAVA